MKSLAHQTTSFGAFRDFCLFCKDTPPDRGTVHEIGTPRSPSCDLTVQCLLDRGISLAQLLGLYTDLFQSGVVRQGMKTEEFVREVVIPQTSAESCCFMESEFMRQRGGPRHADRLVSHTWGAELRDTILSAAIAASGLGSQQLDEWLAEGSIIQNISSSAPPSCLDTSFWLCFLAVNQHISICGTPSNPCNCGTQKFPINHPQCEVDKFAEVMAYMDGGLVVSLGPDLGALRRVWCLAELSTALHLDAKISFCLSRDMLPAVREMLASGQKAVPQVQDCEASNEEDKIRILGEIERSLGFDRFNYEVQVLIETQGPSVTGFGAWRETQPPTPWLELSNRFHHEVPEEEKQLWRMREIAAFDRERWRSALQDPYRFEFSYFSHKVRRQVHVVGVPASWLHLTAKFYKEGWERQEFEGVLPPGMATYEVVGPGPKLFGVVGRGHDILFHDFGEWAPFCDAKPLYIPGEGFSLSGRTQAHRFDFMSCCAQDVFTYCA